MSKVRQNTPGRRVSYRSEKNTFPATTTLPILGFSPAMGWTAPLMAPPMMTSPPADFFCSSCLGTASVTWIRTSLSW